MSSFAKVIPVATSLQIVAVWFATTGSGLIGMVTENGAPLQPAVLTGVTAYITSTDAGVVFVNASFDKASTSCPLPIGVPVEIERPFKFNAVTL